MLWGNSRVAEGVDKLVASRNNKARTMAGFVRILNGARRRNRTTDTGIFNP